MPIEWKESGRYIVAHIGHLFVYVEETDAYKTPEHEHYEAPRFNWFIAPDDEDKNDRRALEDGTAETFEGAKAAIIVAFHRIRDKLVSDIEELEEAPE